MSLPKGLGPCSMNSRTQSLRILLADCHTQYYIVMPIVQSKNMWVLSRGGRSGHPPTTLMLSLVALHHFVLYLQHLSEVVKSKAAVKEACNSTSWMHSCTGLVSPISDSFARTTLEGLQRSLAKPVVKKEPVTVEM